MEPIRYHGIQYLEDRDQCVLWFGILRFLETLHQFYSWPLQHSDSEPPVWEHKWFDAKFNQAVRRIRDTFWKVNRVAGHLHTNIVTFRANWGEKELERFGKATSALQDIELFLDLLLLYTRIQADCVANVIPNLYGIEGRRSSIPRQSLNGQMRWFLKTRPDFDPDYSDHLRSNVQWFSALAGDQQGQRLRDIMVHYRGLYQVGWAGTPSGSGFQLKAAMVTDTRFVSEDMLEDLKGIMEGYCRFLDMVLTYFWSRLEDELGGQLMPRTQEYFQIYHFPVSHPSLWVYPVVEPDLEHT